MLCRRFISPGQWGNGFAGWFAGLACLRPARIWRADAVGRPERVWLEPNRHLRNRLRKFCHRREDSSDDETGARTALSARTMCEARNARTWLFAVRHRPDCGRSPSAACRPAEADCKNSVLLRLATRCEPGRFAVRWGQCQVRPARRAGPIQAAKKFSRLGQRNKFRAPDAAVLR